MTFPAYIAVCDKKGISQEKISEIASKTSKFYDFQDMNVAMSIDDHKSMVSFSPYGPQTVPLVHMDKNLHCMLTNFVPTEIDEEGFTSKSSRYIQNFMKNMVGENPRLAEIPPPFVYASHNVVNGTCSIANDAFGIGKIYYASIGGRTAVSNKLAAIIFALGIEPTVDEGSWASYATFDWVIDDATFFKEVSLLPPGTHVLLNRHNNTIIEQPHTVAGNRSLSQMNEKDRMEATIETSKSIIRNSVRLIGTDKIQIGLSGGRDSRAIAAIYESLDDMPQPNYYTTTPPDLEAEIAEKLIATSSTRMNWKILQSRNDPAGKPIGENHIERAEYWFRRFDGDVWPSYVMNDIPPDNSSLNCNREITGGCLSGGGAEIVKSHFYGSGDIENPVERIRTVLNGYVLRNSLVAGHAKQVAVTKMESVLLDGYLNGYSGLHLLDWFYVRSQQRRRTPLAFTQNAFLPLIHPQMFWAGFNISAEEKLENDLIKKISGLLKPEWKDIPFFADIASKRPLSETDKTMVGRLYWEGDRQKYLECIEYGLAETDVFEKSAIDQLVKIDRKNPKASQFHNTSARILWHGGFKKYREKLQLLQREKPPVITFDRILSNNDMEIRIDVLRHKIPERIKKIVPPKIKKAVKQVVARTSGK